MRKISIFILFLILAVSPLQAGYLLQNSNTMTAEDIINFYEKNIEQPEALQEYQATIKENIPAPIPKEFIMGRLLFLEAYKIEKTIDKIQEKYLLFFVDKYLLLLEAASKRNYPLASLHYANVYFGGEMKQIIDLNLALIYYKKAFELDYGTNDNIKKLALSRINLIKAIRNGTAKHPINPDVK